MKNIILVLACLSATICSAQHLDFNNVDAQYNSNGLYFYSPTGLGYEIPKGGGVSTLSTLGIWCASSDANGSLRLAGSRFNSSGQDYFAGPYSTSNDYTNPSYVAAYSNSNWEVTRAEILTHQSNFNQTGYVIPSSILNWPGNGDISLGVVQNLAPFVDLNGNNLYEPVLGDYPDVRGDKAAFIIVNDGAQVHGETGGNSLGIELHVIIYQIGSSDYLNNTTFINVRVFNRTSIGHPSFKLALYSDVDLGYGFDDYVGCDSTLNLSYVYNATNNDSFFAINPPAFGVLGLNKDFEYMSYISNTTNGANVSLTDPIGVNDYFNYMNGKWKDGTDWLEGGSGHISDPNSNPASSAKFVMSGNPNTSGTWNALAENVVPNDLRSIVTFGEENLAAFGNTCFDFAFIFSREPGNNHIQNVNSLIAQAAVAKNDFDAMSTYNCNQVTLGFEELDATQVELYPNPSHGSFTLTFGEKPLTGKVRIQDLSGRVVFENVIEGESAMKIEMKENIGVYLLSIQTEKGIITKKIAIQ